MEGTDVLAVTNPANEELITRIYIANTEMIEQAVSAADRAFSNWSELPARKRSQYLFHIRDQLLKRKEEIGRTLSLEQGKPLGEAIGEIIYSAEFFGWYAEEAKRLNGELIPPNRGSHELKIEHVPVGVVAAITPWNFPAGMLARKLAPALASGCTVIVKPASQTPLTAVKMFEILEEVGLPDGVANLIVGSGSKVGKQLLSDRRVRKVTFTGSTEIGTLIMKMASEHVTRISLELGGHAPFIVLQDANLERSIRDLLMIKFRASGQTCISPNRVFVQQNIYNQFTEQLIQKVRGLKIGSFDEERVAVGPLIDRNAIALIQKQVDDAVAKGANLLYGGEVCKEFPLQRGNFYMPTVLGRVSAQMNIFNEETFGPIIPIIPYETEEDLIRLANDSKYGLSAYIYSNNYSNARKIAAKLECGTVCINDVSVSDLPQAPIGGMKMSGIGREGGQEGIFDFLETKITLVNYL